MHHQWIKYLPCPDDGPSEAVPPLDHILIQQGFAVQNAPCVPNSELAPCVTDEAHLLLQETGEKIAPFQPIKRSNVFLPPSTPNMTQAPSMTDFLSSISIFRAIFQVRRIPSTTGARHTVVRFLPSLR
jgi:hypothetical protein